MRKTILLLCLFSALSIPVRAVEAPKYIALTFDDGPSGRFTRTLLEGLAQRDVHATFFLCGYRLENQADLAAQIRRNGHEIGLHGYSHDPMSEMSRDRITRELRRTRALLPGGTLVNLLRTPGGERTDTVCLCAQQENLTLIHWSVDPRDWACGDPHIIAQRILEQAKDGDIILLHDMTDSSVTAALAVVDQLQAQGYRFLTVSQLAMLRLTHLQPGRQHSAFPPAH